MIDLSINKVGLEHNIQKAKENHIIIPTIAQMQNPDLIPEKIKAKLSTTGLFIDKVIDKMIPQRGSNNNGASFSMWLTIRLYLYLRSTGMVEESKII